MNTETKKQLAKLQNLCRACCTLNDNMKPIFDNEINSVPISSMLTCLVPLILHSNDNLSKSLCSPCLSKLQEAHKFQQMYIESDRKMRNILNIINLSNQSPIMVEIGKPKKITTEADIIEHNGQLIKFENQDYDEFDTIDLSESTTTVIKFKCKHCNSEFSSEMDLKAHSQTHEINVKTGIQGKFSCNFCGKRFQSWGDLGTHCLLKHRIDKSSVIDDEQDSQIKNIEINQTENQIPMNSLNTSNNILKTRIKRRMTISSSSPLNSISSSQKSISADKVTFQYDRGVYSTRSVFRAHEKKLKLSEEKNCQQISTERQPLKSANIEKQTSEEHEIDEYKCNFCNKSYESYSEVVRHKNNVHMQEISNRKAEIKEICNLIKSTKDCGEDHLNTNASKSTTNTGSEKDPLNINSTDTSKVMSYDENSQSETVFFDNSITENINENPKKLKCFCLLCKQICSSFKAGLEHYHDKHLEHITKNRKEQKLKEYFLSCTVCSKSFKISYDFNKHFERHKADEDPSLELILTDNKLRNSLENDCKPMHTCCDCSERFRDIQKFIKHLKKHPNSKKSKAALFSARMTKCNCPICKKSLRCSQIKEHLANHRENSINDNVDEKISKQNTCTATDEFVKVFVMD